MKQLHLFLKQHGIVITIIAAFVIARIVTLSTHAIVDWDAAVYVGMGKYLFSHGTIGTWEILRPVGLPIVLGLFWNIGISPYMAGVVLSMLISVGTLVLVYMFAQEVRRGAGNIAVMVLVSSAIFFRYSAVPVTDISSTFFALLGIFLVHKAVTNKQYIVAGLVMAMAFLFRFPQGLVIVVGVLLLVLKMISEKGKWNVRIVHFIERGFSLAGGFLLLAVPFLIINQYAYGNAFLPFIEATAVIKLYPTLYNKGIFFYAGQLLRQDPLFLLALAPMALLAKKKYRHPAVMVMTVVLVVFAGYFTYQAHKELRYALAFLPYLSILTGAGIAYALEYWKLPQLLFFGLFIIVGFMVYAPLLTQPLKNPSAPAWYDFNTYLARAPRARVLSSTPYLLAYSDVLITRNLYDDWNDAYLAYHTYKNNADYVTLDSCNLELGCADNAHCKDDKQSLLSELSTQATQVFSETTPDRCVLEIYKISH